jgi:NAD(P)-dependent dehydrogenase (short-subunit alcohol dehydrogenase family)
MSERVALITGGAGGIGTAVAERFLDAGDRVVLADLRTGTVGDADPGDRVASSLVDVSVVADCARMVEEATARWGRLDVLINAAGVWTEGDSWDTTEEAWDRTVDVNLKGTFFAGRFALPELMKTAGCIVNISSDTGLVGNSGNSVYNASKWGVNGVTKSLALELAPHGVRVNSVCPADVDTPMLAGQARDFGGGDPRGYLDALLNKMPQGARARFIEPREIAALVFFLASADAAPITGACVPIDCGVTAGY